MKQFIIILIMLLSIQTFAQNSIGELTFKTTTIDYGFIEQNSNGQRFFVLKNTGNAPVIIENVKASYTSKELC